MFSFPQHHSSVKKSLLVSTKSQESAGTSHVECSKEHTHILMLYQKAQNGLTMSCPQLQYCFIVSMFSRTVIACTIYHSPRLAYYLLILCYCRPLGLLGPPSLFLSSLIILVFLSIFPENLPSSVFIPSALSCC